MISQHVEKKKTNGVLQRVEVDAALPSSVGSVSVGISLDMTSGGVHVAVFDVEQVDLIAVKETKKNPQK